MACVAVREVYRTVITCVGSVCRGPNQGGRLSKGGTNATQEVKT